MNVTWLFCVRVETVKLSNECQYTVLDTVPCTGRIFLSIYRDKLETRYL